MTSFEDVKQWLDGAEFIDLAPLLYSNMPHWPTHPDLSIIADARNHAQHGYFCQTLIIPEHSGCHVDAPPHVHGHLMDQTIETFPANFLIAPGTKVDASGLGLQPGEVLRLAQFETLAHEQGVQVSAGDVVLIQFGWDKYLDAAESSDPAEHNWWGANEPGFDEDLCRFLAEQHIRAVGTDTVACDIAEWEGNIVSGYGHETYFLPRRILIIEGLYGLNRLPASFYFFAIPLKIKGGSGSPIRPVALVPGS